MSALGGRTKKVTTYGRKKTQIISVHSDIRSGSTEQSASPLPVIKARPPLQSKRSQDVVNIPSTPGPQVTAKTFKPSHLVESRVSSRSPTPETVLKPRKVPRVARRAVIVPHSPAATPNRVSRTTAEGKGRDVLEGVVIPLKSSAKKPSVQGLTDRLSRVTIEDSLAPAGRNLKKTTSLQEKHPLTSLVQQCTSSTVHPFSTFLQSSHLPKFAEISKVGEASYSEVFGLTTATTDSASSGVDLVLKIIPLLDGEANDIIDGPLPDCTSPEDVAREIQVTKRMGNVPGGGFVTFKGAYIVEGEYPAGLLEQWDEFKHTLGSASVRPSNLPSSQKYCLIALSHAGVDLESFKFDLTKGWLQAAGVFWQVVASLTRAEQWTNFEHRDLHEGQVLISYTSSPDAEQAEASSHYLDATYTGVEATIIDFGLSRLNMESDSSSCATWTPVPEEVYEGKGAQWDLYRAMRGHLDDDWEKFHPFTNVLWLHYIIRYMLESKSIRKPRPPQTTSRRSRTKATIVYEQNEKAYNMLIQVEKVLSWSVDYDLGGVGKKTRRGLRGEPEGEKLLSAKDVMEWGKREKLVV
ncbi:hypothetical protein IAR55_003083 [Kwoniella newhampshirensis]|uniref:non-specific serine/threonine protein kinase n=1 Tax=Kwoniella newhampshirensis TaxID=1651941 RepID=A0AAW0YQZ7_9TREE